MSDYIDAADAVRRGAREEPMSLGEYVDRALADPAMAAHASKYLLDAIEAAGTRTVVEEGETVERYRFFDDPHNDGEHAVLGNTDTLNDFVDDLRAIAANRGKGEKILWFAGPTATGKSELKRCLVNGLREYSKTAAGRRYTLEWNVADDGDAPGLSYGWSEADEGDWYRSPVQVNPLSVFPAETRRDLLADLNEGVDVPVRVDADLDPFSAEVYERLEARQQRRGGDALFSAVTDPGTLRVANYVVDVGRGVGVLHAEDAGTPRERLVGSWMGEVLRDVRTRGRKNPQAFSYDGVLSQGNGGLTVVEDAAQHADLLQKLLNVPDERTVKLDQGIRMDLDTQLVVISNLDLEAQLNEHADRQGTDPLKALKRRLSKHRFGYLTNLSLEAQLLWRELTGETGVWDATSYEALAERYREPLHLTAHADGEARGRELAPHAVEAAALYSVVTRLDPADLPRDLDLVDKALLYDRGYLRVEGEEGAERTTLADYDLETAADGTNGVPVTYTRDVLADLLHEDTGRRHPDLDVAAVLLPGDVLDALVSNLAADPLFSAREREAFEERVAVVKDYVADRQERDVLAAMLRDHEVAEGTVGEYVEHVYAWATDRDVETAPGQAVEPDPLKMKLFETDHLGFGESDYAGTDPGERVREFREGSVVAALNRHAWEQRDEAFQVGDVNPREVPAIRAVLAADDWSDVRRRHEDFDPSQWADPPADTATAALKATTVANLVEHHGYSPASAELTSRRVVEEVSHRWD